VAIDSENLFVCWSEVQRDTIHTVPGISGSFEAFPPEHMAQMSSTRCTSDFNTPAILIPLHPAQQILVLFRNYIQQMYTNCRNTTTTAGDMHN
jgi:hypothetical protein